MSEPTVDEPIILPLTFAELGYLATIAPDAQGVDAGLRRLRLQPAAIDDGIRSAGIASLVVRGLAALRDDAVELSPVAAAVASTLFGPGSTTSVAVVGRSHLEAFDILDGPPRLLVRPVAMFIFEFVVLDSSAVTADICATAVANAFAAIDGPIEIPVQRVDPAGTRSVVVRRDEAGSVACSAASGAEVTTEEMALVRVRELLG